MPERNLHLVIPGLASATVYLDSSSDDYNLVTMTRPAKRGKFRKREQRFDNPGDALRATWKFIYGEADKRGLGREVVEDQL